MARLLFDRCGRGVCVAFLLVGIFGCHPEPEEPTARELRVYAASSLTEAFQALEVEFEKEHPNIDVQLAFGGSQVLRLQLEQGARAGVFASANGSHVEALHKAGLVHDAHPIAENELCLIVPRTGNTIERLEQLPEIEHLVVGAPTVPLGSYTLQLLKRLKKVRGARFVDRVTARIASRESNVRLARAKVEFGEADAAFVYRTDALASDKVKSVPIPSDVNVRARYHLAVIRGPQQSAASEFKDFVLSRKGQSLLRGFGFSGRQS